VAATVDLVQADVSAGGTAERAARARAGAVVRRRGQRRPGCLAPAPGRGAELGEGPLGADHGAMVAREHLDLAAAPRHDRIGGAVDEREPEAGGRRALRRGLGAEACRHRDEAVEHVARVAREPQRHHAAIRHAGDADPRTVDREARRERRHQLAEEADVVDVGGDRTRAGVVAAVVPAAADALGVDDQRARTVGVAVEAPFGQRLHAGRGAATSVQHDDERGAGRRVRRHVQPVGALASAGCE